MAAPVAAAAGGASGDAAGGGDARHERRVHVTPLLDGVEEAELRTAFTHCGTITDVHIVTGTTGMHRYGFVEFADAAAAKEALQLSGMRLGDGAVYVNPATQTTDAQVTNMPRMRAGMTVADQANQMMYSAQLYTMQQINQMYADKERERKARAVQKKALKERAKRKRQMKKDGIQSDTDSEFDSALSTDEREERRRQRRDRKSKRRKREGSGSDASSIPSPPRVAYRGY
eukprot:TRINITY_DN12757_c0_g1_i1.p1 TRINITY_DN12757_c0_g1~~TRINITY_DN12757_c0_g1_i1.p1  ORF type:complete len:230 (+),score=50.45 TRINITY_DN12757_c0_g1_i1:56-745(+)